MARAKTHNFGTQLWYSSDNGASWAQILDLKKISLPRNEPSEADTTHLESENREEESIPSWKKTGTCGFTCFFVADQFAALKALEAGEYDLLWQARYPLLQGMVTRSTSTFGGQIASCEMDDIERNDTPLMYEVKISKSRTTSFSAGA